VTDQEKKSLSDADLNDLEKNCLQTYLKGQTVKYDQHSCFGVDAVDVPSDVQKCNDLATDDPVYPNPVTVYDCQDHRKKQCQSFKEDDDFDFNLFNCAHYGTVIDRYRVGEDGNHLGARVLLNKCKQCFDQKTWTLKGSAKEKQNPWWGSVYLEKRKAIDQIKWDTDFVAVLFSIFMCTLQICSNACFVQILTQLFVCPMLSLF
jgi:hypothetical protein